MKKKRYFGILLVSSVIFLGSFIALIKSGRRQSLWEEEGIEIDFIEQTNQNTPTFVDHSTELEEEPTVLEQAQNGTAANRFTENEENINLTTLEQAESETNRFIETEEAVNLTASEHASETAIEDFDKEFYSVTLTEEHKKRITGKSYPDTTEPIQISYDALAYIHILHYDFEGQVQEGELICNQAIAQDLVDIFRALYEQQYAIEKVRLIDEYDADDERSMADNNTSCFNYRTVPGKTKLSNHSYGYAIDINPLYNPYVRTRNGTELISPENGAVYADRGADFPHKIDKNDLCYQLFMEHGFEWGGAWNSSKDYQHFEKTKNY